MRTVSETSEATLNAPPFALYGSQKEKREKGPEKICEEIIAKNFSNVRKETLKSRKHRVPYKITQGGTHQDTY